MQLPSVLLANSAWLAALGWVESCLYSQKKLNFASIAKVSLSWCLGWRRAVVDGSYGGQLLPGALVMAGRAILSQ